MLSVRLRLVLSCVAVLLVLGSCTGRGDSQGGSPGATSESLDWRGLHPEAIADEDATAISLTCRRFFELLQAGNKDAAYALLDPADRDYSFYSPSVRQVKTLESMDLGLISETVVRVRASVVYERRSPGAGQGKLVRHVTYLFFERSDPDHSIRMPRAEFMSSPVFVADRFEPWWEKTALTGEALQAQRLRTVGIMSRQWNGWDADPERTMQRVAEWWSAQEAEYGGYDRTRGWPPMSTYVWSDGVTSIVDCPMWFGVGAKSNKVTYRLRMLLETRAAGSEDAPTIPTWRIAEVVARTIERVPVPGADTQAGAP